MFRSNLASFARAAVPAALVNSGLKYMQVSVVYSATTTGNRLLMKEIKLVNCLTFNVCVLCAGVDQSCFPAKAHSVLARVLFIKSGVLCGIHFAWPFKCRSSIKILLNPFAVLLLC